MRKYTLPILTFLCVVMLAFSALAQNSTGLVVATCGSPTFNVGNPGPFTVDSHGNLCGSSSGGGGGSVTQGTIPWVVGVTQWGGGTLGAMANYGTSPGAVLAPGVNAFITNSPAITGTVTANQGTSPWVISGAVTNAGTFAVQAAQTTSPWIVAGGGTAGTAATGVVTVQGIASMTKLLVTPDSVALPANQSVNTAQVNGITTLTGTGATGTGAQRVTVATDQATNAGAALVKGGVGVVNGGNFYQAVAASATATVLQSSTGAAGDYLSHCVLYPTSTSPGVVTVFDNTNAAGTSAILFPGGASSLSNLAPIPIPVGAISVSGAWKVTTGASISVVCYGKFS